MGAGTKEGGASKQCRLVEKGQRPPQLERGANKHHSRKYRFYFPQPKKEEKNFKISIGNEHNRVY